MAVEVYRGITEVGHVADGTDVPWGKTSEDGITISHSVTRESLYSGQDLAPVDDAIMRIEASVTFRLIEASLANLARTLGLPEDAVSGSGPTAVLTVLADELGTEEFHLYAIQPGPNGPRRYDFKRAKVGQPGDINVSKTAWTLPQSTYTLLVDDDGKLWEVGPAT